MMAGSNFSMFRLVAIAAAAGVMAGGIAVYVSGGLEGNGAAPASVVSAPPADGAAVQACAAKAGKAKAVGAAATGEVAAMMAADPARSVRDLSFNDPSGRKTDVGSLAGKTLLINLWATWCAPCRAEMPALDALQADLGGDTFEVVAVNVDTGDDVKPRKFLEETNIRHLAYYRDNTLALFNDLKKRGLALGLPVTLLVDEEGCLLANMNGPAEWAGADAKRLVEAAMRP